MARCMSLLVPIIFCLLGCSNAPVEQPTGPTARFGAVPVIDGQFQDGEWDDAAAVTLGENQHLRMKHDSSNLYLAFDGGGGNLWFNKDSGLQVLHWSAQLGTAEYRRIDSTTQTLEKPFDFTLWGLQHESPSVIRETLKEYLTENGWVANLAPMGPKMQTEFAISFDWFGISLEDQRFVETPGFHIGAGLMLTRDDPEAEAIMAMSLEERKKQYPSFYWPVGSGEGHPMNRGNCPDTIHVDPSDFATIWIDFRN